MVATNNSPVKKLLKEKGITQAEIARHLSLSPSFVSQVISRKRKSNRVYLYIQLRLKKRYDELWGRAA